MTAERTAEIRKTATGRPNGDFHLYVGGNYHCTCVSESQARDIAAKRFPQHSMIGVAILHRGQK